MKTIIKRCVRLRASKGLSQRDLAARIGCSQSLVSLMESGKTDAAKLVGFWSRRGLKVA